MNPWRVSWRSLFLILPAPSIGAVIQCSVFSVMFLWNAHCKWIDTAVPFLLVPFPESTNDGETPKEPSDVKDWFAMISIASYVMPVEMFRSRCCEWIWWHWARILWDRWSLYSSTASMHSKMDVSKYQRFRLFLKCNLSQVRFSFRSAQAWILYLAERGRQQTNSRQIAPIFCVLVPFQFRNC